VAEQEQIAEADHHRQQIVEVMGDAARQLSHGLEPQGLGELRLEARLSAWEGSAPIASAPMASAGPSRA
jgi:hypothetical protein